ncbi:hypothetical protein F53441_6570 [Fusarium austroafricanum]|uniref:Uncharacterized protein n=1 Tax=Fusarium austroafricanum TaxID=2364996 RepID=A0A8H4P6W3_9HYPO|nr:hypothetical protein F53441_6570 [Fusarium austroafricanum]
MATVALINGAVNDFDTEESHLSHSAVKSAPIEKITPVTPTIRNEPDVDETSPYHNPRLALIDRFLDEPRPVRVGVIGAGLAGITAGILLPAKVPGIKLTIYEKNADVAGTWFENVYPGVRCDIASHVYQSTFAPKTDWSDKYAPGHEIREYWQSVARKFDVYKYVKLDTRVEGTTWDDDEGVWVTKLRNVKTGEETSEKNEFILTSIGRFNDWKLPDYPGISEYKGHLRHASNWSTDFDPKDKTVAVIGNGASGIQITANLQPIVKRLDHYARNKTWIAASWAGEERKLEAQPYTKEEKEKWAEDPDAYLAFRKDLEGLYWTRFDSFFRNSESNRNLREAFIGIMKKRLAKKPELLEHIVPDFSPNCRRLTPGPGYLEAITEDNVEYIRTRIRRFTETGIETEDGKQRDVDAIICATGANVDMVPAFPIRAHGQELGDLWKADGLYGYPYTYFGLGTPGFPNLLFVHGPQATGPSGTVPHSVETQLTYFAKVLRKASREGIKSISPSKQAADDFIEYSDAFFAKTVLTDRCSSWYNGGKPGSRIHGLWPGSAGHITVVRQEPRWEDWEYSEVPPPPKDQLHPVKWYRSTFFNITILGLCNLSAPGIWTAMNSLGAGGAASPKLINAANALTFCLMVVSCYFSSAMVRYIGIKGALIFGTLGYAPYAAGLYTNNRFGTEWLVLLGAALCGISAGVFWMAEAAIAIAYPEPWNRGKALGYWLTYRLSGQILGGAINLGLNADRNEAGKVSYTVFLVFIALQAAGPFVALLLSKPDQVERKDGVKVRLSIDQLPGFELKETARLFFTKKFLLIVLFIGQAVFAESVFFTYLALWFSVRSRALGSFLGGIVAVIGGNVLGSWLDRTKVSLRIRTRSSFAVIATLQGGWWIWATILVSRFRETRPTYDWASEGFGHSFAVFLFLTLGFQLNYLFLYFIIHHLAGTQDEIIRYSALLRGTESAWQAVSYGITSLPLFAEVGGVYFNFALWAVSLFPAWLVLKDFGSRPAPSLESPIQEVDSQNDVSHSGEESDIKKF